MYLYHCARSACFTSVSCIMPISCWPPVATSWWSTNVSMPIWFSVSTIVQRRSAVLSNGGAGEYPSLPGILYPRFGPSSAPVFHAASTEST
jgi:hypothetical protein